MARKPDYDVDSVKTVAKGGVAPLAAQSVRLAVVEGPSAGARATVGRRAIQVGRAGSADFQVADPTVSSFHLEVAAADGGLRVRDLGSRNGTVYAGARLLEAIVPSGAVLELGGSKLRVELDQTYEAPLHGQPFFGELVGTSALMRELFAALARLSPTDLTVLVEGPTGTGKELVARALHHEGQRRERPLVVLDCTAIPATLAESTLFGHEKGAFTGANEARVGVFEAADTGTVFLDEVGELPLELQPKLLRVLEQRQIVRVGGTKPRAVDVRVVCATWRDLRAMVNQGRFREDLYYRLAQARVSLPTLRERAEDIPGLVEHFLREMPSSTRCARAIAADALVELSRRDYPGNVRELRSTVQRAAMLAAGDTITTQDLAFERMLGAERQRAEAAPPPPEDEAPLAPFKDAKRSVVEEFERDYLQRLLARSGGNVSRASTLASIERHHLRDLFRKHGLRGNDG